MQIMDSLIHSIFFVELLIFSVPFLLAMPKRSRFSLRLIIALAVWLLLPFVRLSSWDTFFLLSFLQDLILFLLFSFGIFFCFRCSIWTTLYCATGAYAFQQIGLQINVTTECFQIFFGGFSVWRLLGYLAVIAVLVFLEFRIFYPSLKQFQENQLSKRSVLIVSAFLIVVMSIFNAANNISQEPAPVPFSYIIPLFIFLCCVFTLWLEYGFFQLERAHNEIALMRQLEHTEKNQFELLRETTDMINMKCHDMKYVMSMLRGQQQSDTIKELQSIQDLIDIYDFSVDTGNRTLNLILAEKRVLCQKKSIRLNCMADGNSLSFLEDSDLYSLFGNALDNSIRAIQSLEDEDQRILILDIRQRMGLISIRIENYYNEELHFTDGLPDTTQKSAGIHGYGMRSMRYIVEKYNGEMNISTENGIFALSFLFPLSTVS